jgi:hypothetical protein
MDSIVRTRDRRLGDEGDHILLSRTTQAVSASATGVRLWDRTTFLNELRSNGSPDEVAAVEQLMHTAGEDHASWFLDRRDQSRKCLIDAERVSGTDFVTFDGGKDQPSSSLLEGPGLEDPGLVVLSLEWSTACHDSFIGAKGERVTTICDIRRPDG